jgi:preprotein translocase SecE subunit
MKITEYLKEVRAELTHVSFPTKRQTTLFTVFVIVLSLGVALYLGLFDYLFKIGIERVFGL